MPVWHGEALIDLLEARSGLLCLVGAGGKKSTMARLVAQHPGRVAVTATVHTLPFRRGLADVTVIAPHHRLAARVRAETQARVVAYACPSDKRARLAGVDPELVARLHRDCAFDLTVIKADGARLRRIKAPGEHEPVLPPGCATMVSLLSIRALGLPLDAGIAHRPERIAALTGAAPGQRLGIEHLACLLSHPGAGLKFATGAARVIPVINMVDTPAQLDAARRIARQVLDRAALVDRVVLTRMVAEQPVLAVVRRAGGSTSG